MPRAPVFVLGPHAKDLTGQVFGRLRVIRPERKNAWNEWYWRCRCECGRSHVAPGKSLRSTKAIECRSCANYRARYGLAPADWADRADFNADRELRLKRRWRAKRRERWQRIKNDPEAKKEHLRKRREAYARGQTATFAKAAE